MKAAAAESAAEMATLTKMPAAAKMATPETAEMTTPTTMATATAMMLGQGWNW